MTTDSASHDQVPNAAATRPRRRWPRYSLRTLLLVMLLFACAAAWVGHEIQKGRDQLAAIAWIEAQGGQVFYAEQAEPLWQQQWFGEWYPNPVSHVNLHEAVIESIAPLRHLTHLKALSLESTQVAAVGALYDLPELRFVDVTGTPLSLTQIEQLGGDTRQILVLNRPVWDRVAHASRFIVAGPEKGLTFLTPELGPPGDTWSLTLPEPLGAEESILWYETIGQRFLIAAPGRLICIDMDQQEFLWQYERAARFNIIAHQGELEFIGVVDDAPAPSDSTQHILAVDLTTGQVEYELDLPRSVAEKSSFAVEGYFILNSGNVGAHDYCYVIATDGQRLLYLEEKCYNAIPLEKSILVQTAKKLTCYDLFGTEQWKLPWDGIYSLPQLVAVALPDGDLALGCSYSDGTSAPRILRLDSTTGEVRWQSTCPEIKISPPTQGSQGQQWNVRGNNHVEFVTLRQQGDSLLVYVRSYTPFVQLLQLEDGKLLDRWVFPRH